MAFHAMLYERQSLHNDLIHSNRAVKKFNPQFVAMVMFVHSFWFGPKLVTLLWMISRNIG
jgi:hypothetical protein